MSDNVHVVHNNRHAGRSSGRASRHREIGKTITSLDIFNFLYADPINTKGSNDINFVEEISAKGDNFSHESFIRNHHWMKRVLIE